MKIIKQFVYEKAYRKKVIIICLISILICLLNNYAGYELIPIPHKNVKMCIRDSCECQSKRDTAIRKRHAKNEIIRKLEESEWMQEELKICY